jgi:hypothetical protein
MVALDKRTGETVWKCAIPTASTVAGYASVVVAEVGGVKQSVQFFDVLTSASRRVAPCLQLLPAGVEMLHLRLRQV